MKVNSNIGKGLQGVETPVTKGVEKNKTKNSADIFSSDKATDSAKVNLSDRAQAFQKAKEIASQPDTVDEAKVARLQKLIDEGKYNIDAAAIADKLVDDQMSFPE